MSGRRPANRPDGIELTRAQLALSLREAASRALADLGIRAEVDLDAAAELAQLCAELLRFASRCGRGDRGW